MDGTFIFFIFLVFILLGAIILTLSLDSAGEKVQANAIKGTSFIPSQMFLGNDGLAGIAVNDKTLQICLLKNPDLPPRLLPTLSLAGSYLIKNAEVLGKSLRTGPKSLIAFQKGMHSRVEQLITSWEETPCLYRNQRIDLIVLIHNEEDPLHVVNFLDMETKEGGILYEKALGTATHWHHVVCGLILQADQHTRLQTEPDHVEPEISSASIADELKKLGDLVEQKIITPQEFTVQKEMLLGSKV